jgi:ketosteroid isomerase-like protein
VSQANVDIVRRAFDVAIAGFDKDDFGAVFDEGFFAPSARLIPTTDAAGDKVYVGRDGWIEWGRTWTEDFRDWKVSVEDIVDGGDDHVVAVVHQSAIGKASGVAVEQRLGMLFKLAGGQIVEQRHYIDPADALRDVGLGA